MTVFYGFAMVGVIGRDLLTLKYSFKTAHGAYTTSAGLNIAVGIWRNKLIEAGCPEPMISYVTGDVDVESIEDARLHFSELAETNRSARDAAQRMLR